MVGKGLLGQKESCDAPNSILTKDLYLNLEEKNKIVTFICYLFPSGQIFEGDPLYLHLLLVSVKINGNLSGFP